MPGPKNGERPYLAVPEAGFSTPILACFSATFRSAVQFSTQHFISFYYYYRQLNHGTR